MFYVILQHEHHINTMFYTAADLSGGMAMY